MISILDIAPDVLGYRAEGKLDRADIDRVFAEVERKLAGAGRIRVLAEVVSLSGISLEALWRDVRLSVQNWKAVGRIEKAALVTDLDWLRRAAVWEDRVLAGIEIRVFGLAQRDEARAWVQS